MGTTIGRKISFVAAVVLAVGIMGIPLQGIQAKKLPKTHAAMKKQTETIEGFETLTGFKISWNKVEGAKGYQVYAYGVAAKKWRCIKKIKRTNYEVTGLLASSKAKIKVRAYGKNEKGKTIYGKFSKTILCVAKNDVYQVDQDGNVKKAFYDKYAAEKAFVLQNKLRKKNGSAKMKWSETIYKICKIRARQLGTDFSHEKFLSTSKAYLRKLGIKEICVYQKPKNGISVGKMIVGAENIAFGQATGKEVIRDWKSSGGHYSNMVNKSYKSGAIAGYMAKDGQVYWVAIFSEVDADKVVKK
jgi:uncharacterized protein YkwD